jgi:hypothetical protein
MITKIDGRLTAPIAAAADLLDTLDLLGEVLRYASIELRHEIADHYQADTYDDLIQAVDHHAELLRRATAPTGTKEPTPK